MQYLKAFIAGFVSTLIFHQAIYGLFWLAGVIPGPPYGFSPTWPLGVPSVISLAFWGGVWGIPLWLLIRHSTGSRYWLRAIVFGALAPSAVALFMVFPLKGLAFAAGWNPVILVAALILNGAWGFGAALFLRLLRAVDRR
jgi:hypothetical protein